LPQGEKGESQAIGAANSERDETKRRFHLRAMAIKLENMKGENESAKSRRKSEKKCWPMKKWELKVQKRKEKHRGR
jgi:hypothetical protein